MYQLQYCTSDTHYCNTPEEALLTLTRENFSDPVSVCCINEMEDQLTVSNKQPLHYIIVLHYIIISHEANDCA